MLAGISGAEPVHLEHVAQQARQRAECQRGGVSLTPSNDDIDVMYRSDRRELTDQATLANSGGTDNSDEATAISGKHALQPGQLGIAAQHHAFVAPQHHPVRLHGEQAPGRHGRVSAFDGNVFDGPEPGAVLDEACCGERTQHSARRCGSLHPLRHPDGMPDCSVSSYA